MTKELKEQLTWRDIKQIVKIADDLIDCVKRGSVAFSSEEAYYEMIKRKLK